MGPKYGLPGFVLALRRFHGQLAKGCAGRLKYGQPHLFRRRFREVEARAVVGGARFWEHRRERHHALPSAFLKTETPAASLHAATMCEAPVFVAAPSSRKYKIRKGVEVQDTDKDVMASPESNVRVRLGRWRAIAAEETEEETDGALRCASFLFR